MQWRPVRWAGTNLSEAESELQNRIEVLARELEEARARQTATDEVLQVISRSAFDLEPVLQGLVKSAVRLCGADSGVITLRVGDTLRFMAGYGQSEELYTYERTHPHPIGRGTFQGRAALEGRTIHVPDVRQDEEYERPEASIIGNFRTVLCVPLRRAEEIVGVFALAETKGRAVRAASDRTGGELCHQAVSRSRTCACSKRCRRETAKSRKHWSSRPRPARCYASSPRRRPTSTPCWRCRRKRCKLCDAYDAVICSCDGETLIIGAHYGPIPLDFALAPQS